MKISITAHALWALGGIVAFCIGYAVAGNPDATRSESQASSVVSAVSATRLDTELRPFENGTGREDGSERVDAEEIRSLTFELLSDPNRVSRMRRLCDMLNTIDASNWRAVLEAYAIQMRTEGRMTGDNWDLVLEKIGEVAGAAALADALNVDTPVDRRKVAWLLKGWLADEPRGGIAWFNAQPPEVQAWLWEDYVTGVSRVNPEQALELVFAQEGDPSYAPLPYIVANALQRSGIRGGEKLLEAVRSRIDVADAAKSSMFGTITARKVAMLQGQEHVTTDALAWFERYVGESFVGPNSSRDIVSLAASTDPKTTLNWLLERTDRLTPSQSTATFPAVARKWHEQAPEEFLAWITAHAEHPQHDAMVQAIASSFLSAGKIAEARSWAQNIKQPEVRTKVESAIRQSNVVTLPQQ